MNIILLEKIKKLGNIGDIKKVKPGYARNFLIPNNKALLANKVNVENFNKYKEKLNNFILYKKNNEELIFKKINELNELIFYKKSNIKGKLFDSITLKDIIKNINNIIKLSFNNTHIKILPKENIKNIGIHKINIIINKLEPIKINIIVKNKII